MSMRVLLLGGGGREHALAWRLAQSPLLEKLWIGPGNAGTSDYGENVLLRAADPDEVLRHAEQIKADLVIVGPEDPLAAGVVDRLTAAGIPTFGPTRAAHELEWSKTYAKQLMHTAGIATAGSRGFEDAWEARDFARTLFAGGLDCVVKADGLAAGKGVTVCDTVEDALQAIENAMVNGHFGEAGSRIVIEERMRGRETSAHAFTDGTTVRHMPFSCDHKPVFDGDLGQNTGGMGVYSPPGWLDPAIAESIRSNVTEGILRAIAADGRKFQGIIYPGLMMTADGPKVVEFNCRFGDPETEALMPRLRSDLLAICDATAHGRLAEVPVEWSEDATVGVMMASDGYPGDYETGAEITGVGDVDSDVQVFMAGVQRDDAGVLRTAGGRVLCVVASGPTVEEASARAYDNVRRIHFEGAHYRTDIGATANQPLPSPQETVR